MNTYTGYTKDLSEAEKRTNEIEAIKQILKESPNNKYWQGRLAALLEVEPICCCYEVMGDNVDCPVHGKGHEQNHGAFTDAEIEADYQERNDLYMMGMGA